MTEILGPFPDEVLPVRRHFSPETQSNTENADKAFDRNLSTMAIGSTFGDSYDTWFSLTLDSKYLIHDIIIIYHLQPDGTIPVPNLVTRCVATNNCTNNDETMNVDTFYDENKQKYGILTVRYDQNDQMKNKLANTIIVIKYGINLIEVSEIRIRGRKGKTFYFSYYF